jgi:4-hydroxy-tetrahydrodipicolinate reductase
MGAPLRVVVAGYGRLGSELARGFAYAPDIELAGIARRTPVPGGRLDIDGRQVPVGNDLPALLEETAPQVLVEASLPQAAPANVRAALERGVAAVIATSGVDDAIPEIRALAEQRGLGVVWAPNLSLGAVVLMHLATIAARFFDYAEIIELHREKKADAPSGTAIHTARLMEQARLRAQREGFIRPVTHKLTLPEVRGGELGGVGIHSVRLPGLVAHQEVIFGGLGQTLTLRHDTTSNESYVPGAILAAKHAAATRGLTVGLASLLGLE